MKIVLLLVTAPLFMSLTQPPRSEVQPPRAIAPVDSHLVRHPKTKPSSARVKSSAERADPAPAARVAQTPVPVVKPADKARKK